MPASETLPATAMVPTIGRVELLRGCLTSIVATRPRPAEILVVDQSGGPAVADLVATLAEHGVRRVTTSRLGIAHATNVGLREAAHEMVLRTDDDCTVAPDWLAVALDYLTARPDGIVTGTVLPGGAGALVPSVIADAERRDWDGELIYGKLFTGNMAVDRRRALELGGFDERRGMLVAAEDNDFCYRWLKAGRPLRYEPAMRVWHHDWRTPQQLARRWREYALGQGAFYGKHLYGGDRRVLMWLGWDLRKGLRAELHGLRRREPRGRDELRALPLWLPVGVLAGLIEARRLDRRRA